MYVEVALLILAAAAIAFVMLSFLRWVYSRKLEEIIQKHIQEIVDKHNENEKSKGLPL